MFRTHDHNKNMDLSPVFAELAQPTPSREVVIEELDKVTDPLRGGYPTTEIVDDLFNLFTKLICFNQWHIQQYTLSCTKYIFENSTLTKEEKLQSLLKHSDFTEQCGVLLGDAKREVREMSAQCIGQLAIQIGAAILNPQLKIADHIFKPKQTAFAIEGQQMALGRLATAFRIDANESLLMLFKSITNDSELDAIKNESENGYVYWYSTRALLLFVTDNLDVTLSKYKEQFDKSREFVLKTFKQQILDCAFKRLSHHYANARRSAAQVVASVFKSLTEDRDKFILSLLPKDEDKWVQREGHLSAIANCLDVADKPFSDSFADELSQKLLALAEDEIASDTAPVTQKGNANSMAAKALVKILRLHSKDLYEKYVHKEVVKLLRSPIAALLDGGVICTAELKKLGFDVTDLILLMFKDICHSSFPIRDLARRTINVEQVIDEHFDELLETIYSFAENEDNEIRECVAKALQLICQTTKKELPDSITQQGINLAQDSVDTVQAAAADLLRACLTADSAAIVTELVMPFLNGDSDDATLAAIRLLKAAVTRFPDAVQSIAAPSPILAFLSLSSMSSPVVAAAAQQLLFQIAGQESNIDEDVLQRFTDIDPEAADVSEYEDLVAEAAENPALAATFLSAVLQKYAEEIDPVEALGTLPVVSVAELDLKNKEKAVEQVSYLISHIDELSADDEKHALQALADVFADEAIEDKKLLLMALESIRTSKKINIPDPTPFSLSHDSETFAKNAN